MARKRYRPEEITTKLREADVLLAQEMKVTAVKWLKEPQKENARQRRAVSDLTLDKMILQEATSSPDRYRACVEGSEELTKYVTEELEQIVGDKFAFEPDPIKAAYLMIEHIDKKREALKLKTLTARPHKRNREKR